MVTMADLEQAKYAGNGNKRPSYQEAKMMWPTPQANKTTPNTSNPEDLVNSSGEPWQIGEKPYDRRTGKPVTTCLGDAVKMWPTPSASDGPGGPGCSDRDGGENLRTVVQKFPTPKAQDAKHNNSPSELRRHSPSLGAVVAEFPTPKSRDYRSPRGAAGSERDSPDLNVVAFQSEGQPPTGQLSADWVSLLMGYPKDYLTLGDPDGKTEPRDSPSAKKTE